MSVNKPVIKNIYFFHPILSVIVIPTHQLAKFFALILEPLTIDQYTVRDLFSFLNNPKILIRV